MSIIPSNSPLINKINNFIADPLNTPVTNPFIPGEVAGMAELDLYEVMQIYQQTVRSIRDDTFDPLEQRSLFKRINLEEEEAFVPGTHLFPLKVSRRMMNALYKVKLICSYIVIPHVGIFRQFHKSSFNYFDGSQRLGQLLPTDAKKYGFLTETHSKIFYLMPNVIQGQRPWVRGQIRGVYPFLEEAPYLKNSKGLTHVMPNYLVGYVNFSKQTYKESILSPFMNKGDLLEFIEKNPKLCSRSMLKIISEKMVYAVLELHEKGVAHCDVKIENFFVHQEEGKLHIALGDLEYLHKVTKETRVDCATRELSDPILSRRSAVGNEIYQVDVFGLGVALWSLNYNEDAPYSTDYLREREGLLTLEDYEKFGFPKETPTPSLGNILRAMCHHDLTQRIDVREAYRRLCELPDSADPLPAEYGFQDSSEESTDYSSDSDTSSDIETE